MSQGLRKVKKMLSIGLALSLLLLSSQFCLVYGEGVDEEEQYAPGEILVVYDGDTSQEEINLSAQEESADSEILSTTDEGNSIVLVSLPEDQTVESAVEEYRTKDNVVAVSPNYEMELFDAPNDSDIAKQSYLSQISAYDAWTLVDGVEHGKTRVAVLDTGADINHPDLKNVINRGISKEVLGVGHLGPLLGDNYEMGVAKKPSNGHGTHVSGIIAAEANNGVGIAGVGSVNDNSAIDLMVVDVFEGVTTDVAHVIAGMEYACSQNAKVINLSLGMTTNDAVFQAECNKLYNAGVTIVCAAGNYGADDKGKISCVPSDYNSTISVIGVDVNNERMAISNHGSLKDISAPGSAIYSTMADSTYAIKSGTSMACPMVTATVALMYSVYPDITPDEVRTILHDTATDIGAQGVDSETAYGLIDMSGAVQKAMEFKTAMKPVPLYRLYSPVNAEHLYTTDANEVRTLVNQHSWNYEGVGWFAPAEGTAVYRLYNGILQNHLYTTDLNEINVLTTTYGWQIDNEGDPLFYSGGSVQVFRLYNEQLRGLHLWTTDNNEYSALPSHGWEQEGLALFGRAMGNSAYAMP